MNPLRTSPSPATPDALSLAGEWTCVLDLVGDGSGRRVVNATLPGSLDAQRIGDAVTPDANWTGTIFDRAYFDSPAYTDYRRPGNIKLPFWLQPETRFVGVARFERGWVLPADWARRRLRLHLERPHWRTRVWIDDLEIGADDSLSTPHAYELGRDLRPGAHRIAVEVDNRLSIEIGENAHSISDHTQGNWNGIVGRIELRATATTRFAQLDVHPDAAARAILVRGRVEEAPAGRPVSLRVRPRTCGDAETVATETRPTTATEVAIAADGGFEARLELGADAPLWDEFNPALHELAADCGDARAETVFGLREFSVSGTRFQINGRPTFLRGTLDCCIFPRTGHPPMDVGSWREILGRIKACGLNHVRFHSWCPPEAAFVAGDEIGVYFQVECATWPNSVAVLAFNSPAGIGDGNAVDAWAYREGERILRAYGNHPCFVLMACGNEPGGPRHRDYLGKWVTHFRRLDPRRLHTATAGWPELPENEFHVIPDPRIHQWGDGLACRVNGNPPATTHDYREIAAKRDRPVISHEIGQWCAYPALGASGKYTGHLKARSHEIFAETLRAHGMADQAEAFTFASGRLQTACYKEEIESSLRTPGLAGFQLLGLQDFPGQGTAPVGMLDAFWEEKGYVDAATIRRFCAATVPLARLDKRVFSTTEHLSADLEVAHFGPAPLVAADISWALLDERGTALRSGRFPVDSIPIGNGRSIARIDTDLAGLRAPAKYTLAVRVDSSAGAVDNDWSVWLYPAPDDSVPPANVSIARTPAEAWPLLAAGRRVLLCPAPECIAGEVALGFSPIFWNTACTRGQAPHTLGLLCDPAHPAFSAFPTDGHADWQWWYPLRRARPFVLDGLPPDLRPVVQVIDDWFTNRRLGFVVEARVGPGRLLLVGADLPAATDPVSRQLLASLLQYAAGETFAPEVSLTKEQAADLFTARES